MVFKIDMIDTDVYSVAYCTQILGLGCTLSLEKYIDNNLKIPVISLFLEKNQKSNCLTYTSTAMAGLRFGSKYSDTGFGFITSLNKNKDRKIIINDQFGSDINNEKLNHNSLILGLSFSNNNFNAITLGLNNKSDNYQGQLFGTILDNNQDNIISGVFNYQNDDYSFGLSETVKLKKNTEYTSSYLDYQNLHFKASLNKEDSNNLESEMFFRYFYNDYSFGLDQINSKISGNSNKIINYLVSTNLGFFDNLNLQYVDGKSYQHRYASTQGINVVPNINLLGYKFKF